MRRTDRMTTFIAVLVFLALLAYLGVYVFRALRSTTVTAQAVEAQATVSVSAAGIIIRDERVLLSPSRYVEVTAPDGGKAAAGSVLAAASDSEELLRRFARIRELEAELDRLASVREKQAAMADPLSLSVARRENAAALAGAVSRHRLDDLDASLLNLKALLLPTENGQVSQEREAALRQELESLLSQSAAESLTAPVSGLFTRTVDGYEHLVPALLDHLTPSALDEMLASRTAPDGATYGKLVKDYHWYFAAVLTAAEGSHIEPGASVTLSFGRELSRPVSAKAVRVSAPENGRSAAVFLCDTLSGEALSLRQASAGIQLEAAGGIRVPAQAVQTDPDTGESYVWAVTARILERKNVDCLYTAEDYAILRRDAAPDSLRAGNTVVVSGEDLYEGKVLD